MRRRFVTAAKLCVLGVAAVALVGCGGDDGESGSGEAVTVDELKSIVDTYNAETPLGTDCEWKAEDWGGEEGASSLAEGAVASEEFACKEIIPVVVADFGDEARATEVAEDLGEFRAGTIVLSGPLDDTDAFYSFVQEECGCGEPPAA
jgi:hypothetical protein